MLLAIQDHIAFTGVPIEGYAKATKATLAVKTAFSSMNFYSHAVGNVRLAIYSDNGSGTAPSVKQWESADITITGGQPKLTTVNITTGTPTTLTLNRRNLLARMAVEHHNQRAFLYSQVAQIQVMPLFKIMALFLPRGQAEQRQQKTGRYMQLFARRQQLP